MKTILMVGNVALFFILHRLFITKQASRLNCKVFVTCENIAYTVIENNVLDIPNIVSDKCLQQ